MTVQRMILNETAYFGRGARSKAIEELKARKWKKALLVTDQVLLDAGVSLKMAELLNDASIPFQVFSEIKANPTVASVKKGVALCAEYGADFIIAVGGGSVIDVAKAISIIMTNPEFRDVVSLDGVADTKNKAMPLIALPTTCGTAAEVTINYVITDPSREKKMVCVDPHDIPAIAIVDPDLMDAMPNELIASTGMDALTHAMEGFITKGAWAMSDMYHYQAIKMIYENIAKASKDKDPVAIENMAYAQYIAGMGFSNVGLGIVHSMAHALGAIYDTPHGLANAMLLPYVLEYNAKEVKDKMRSMGYAMGLDVSRASEEECGRKVVAAVQELATRIGIPQKLKEINVQERDLMILSEKAYSDVCTGGNPKKTSVEDIYALFKKAYE